MTTEEINNIFTYHSPNQTQVVQYQELRDKAKELALLINKHCPSSREASMAITQLQLSVMCANASIAIHTKP